MYAAISRTKCRKAIKEKWQAASHYSSKTVGNSKQDREKWCQHRHWRTCGLAMDHGPILFQTVGGRDRQAAWELCSHPNSSLKGSHCLVWCSPSSQGRVKYLFVASWESRHFPSPTLLSSSSYLPSSPPTASHLLWPLFYGPTQWCLSLFLGLSNVLCHHPTYTSFGTWLVFESVLMNLRLLGCLLRSKQKPTPQDRSHMCTHRRHLHGLSGVPTLLGFQTPTRKNRRTKLIHLHEMSCNVYVSSTDPKVFQIR